MLGAVSPGRVFYWAQKAGFAILDQGLFAGANFVVNILLARWLQPQEYGAFTVAFSIFLLLMAFHTAILSEPLMVFGAGKYAGRFREYLALVLYGHAGMALAIALILAVAAMVFWVTGATALALAVLGLAAASPFILLMWISRRALYVLSQPHRAATGGALYLVLMLAAVYSMFRTHSLSAGSGFMAMGAAGLLAGLWLMALLRPHFQLTGANPTAGMVIGDHWRYGRWSMATAVLTWVPGNIYFATLPAWAGLEGSAALRAVLNLVMPIVHANSAISVLLIPHFVKSLGANGTVGSHRLVRLALLLIAMSGVVYWGLLVLFRHQLLNWLYGGKYGEYSHLVILVGSLPLFAGVAAVFSGALRARQQPDRIFWVYIISSLVALTLGLGLVAAMGTAGAVVGLLASYLALAGAMSWFYAQHAYTQG